MILKFVDHLLNTRHHTFRQASNKNELINSFFVVGIIVHIHTVIKSY
jgi:hypothetical protein